MFVCECFGVKILTACPVHPCSGDADEVLKSILPYRMHTEGGVVDRYRCFSPHAVPPYLKTNGLATTCWHALSRDLGLDFKRPAKLRSCFRHSLHFHWSLGSVIGVFVSVCECSSLSLDWERCVKKLSAHHSIIIKRNMEKEVWEKEGGNEGQLFDWHHAVVWYHVIIYTYLQSVQIKFDRRWSTVVHCRIQFTSAAGLTDFSTNRLASKGS